MALVRRFGRDRRPTATAATGTGTTSTATATEALAAVYDPSVVVQDTNPFIHVAFSGDGCDLVATTRTKLLRFPLSGAAAAEGLAWSALLPARCTLVTTHLPALTANTASTSTSATEQQQQQQQQQQQWSVLCAPEHTATTAAAAVTTAAGTAVDGASQGELLLLGARCGGAAGPAAVALSAAQTVSGHNKAVTAAAFSPDGHWAVTGDCSGVVAVRRRLQRAVAPATAIAASAAATTAGDASHWEERYTVSSTPSAATTVTDAAAATAASNTAAAATAASTAAATRSASETEGNGESPARETPFAPRQQAWTPVSQQQQSQQQQQRSLASVELGLLGGAAPVALHAAMAAVSARTPAH
jgi:hypothetical protein